MANPVEGADYTQYFKIEGESIEGATITGEYLTPSKSLVQDIAIPPEDINIAESTVALRLGADITIQGTWILGLKRVNSLGEVAYTNPGVKVWFDRRLSVT